LQWYEDAYLLVNYANGMTWRVNYVLDCLGHKFLVGMSYAYLVTNQLIDTCFFANYWQKIGNQPSGSQTCQMLATSSFAKNSLPTIGMPKIGCKPISLYIQ
jgi:hypothetical protein